MSTQNNLKLYGYEPFEVQINEFSVTSIILLLL